MQKPIERVVLWDPFWARIKRKGQHCVVLNDAFGRARVRFDDGTEAVLPRSSLTSTGKRRTRRIGDSDRVKAIDSKPQK